LREREPLNYDRMPDLHSLPPRESPEQTAAKSSLRPDTINAAGIRNSFDFAASLVDGGRTVHPASRVFRSAFHGFTRYRTSCFYYSISLSVASLFAIRSNSSLERVNSALPQLRHTDSSGYTKTGLFFTSLSLGKWMSTSDRNFP
jgi:hypothetical protein